MTKLEDEMAELLAIAKDTIEELTKQRDEALDELRRRVEQDKVESNR